MGSDRATFVSKDDGEPRDVATVASEHQFGDVWSERCEGCQRAYTAILRYGGGVER